MKTTCSIGVCAMLLVSVTATCRAEGGDRVAWGGQGAAAGFSSGTDLRGAAPCAPVRSESRYLSIGRVQLAKGEVQEALSSLTRAVAEDPRSAEACRTLAETLRAVGRRAEAQRLETQLSALEGFCLARRKGPRPPMPIAVE